MNLLSNHKSRLMGVSIVLLALAMGFFLMGAVKVYSQGRVAAGTKVFGKDISFLSEAELDAVLSNKIDQLNSTNYEISLNGAVKTIPLSALGVEWMSNRIKDEITIYDAHKNSFVDIFSTYFTRSPQIYFDINSDKLEKSIDTLFTLQDLKTRDAAFELDENGQLIIRKEQPGISIDEQDLKRQISTSISSGVGGRLEIKTINKAPLIKEEDLLNKKEEVEAALKTKVKMHYNNHNWSYLPLEHLNNIKLQNKHYLVVANTTFNMEVKTQNLDVKAPFELLNTVEVVLDSEGTDKFIEEEIEKDVNLPMQKAKIYYDPEGKIVFEGNAQDGQELDRNQFKKMLSLAINHGVNSFNLPVKQVLAEVETDDALKERGIKELIGVGHTTFFGSPSNRVHNINVGVNKFNGLIIKKGEEFSFNQNLGEVEASTGYLPELVIKGNEGTIPEYGGGLCQVSSTMYRSALYAGLPITERSPHSYAVSYYAQILGYGLDATIYPGVRDLKFINDTPGDILVQSYIDQGHAYFKFYGTSDGRTASLEGPFKSNPVAPPPAQIISSASLAPGARQQKEMEHAGFSTTWYRTVNKNGETIKEAIFSKYNAMPAKILVGSGPASEESGVQQTPTDETFKD